MPRPIHHGQKILVKLHLDLAVTDSETANAGKREFHIASGLDSARERLEDLTDASLHGVAVKGALVGKYCKVELNDRNLT